MSASLTSHASVPHPPTDIQRTVLPLFQFTHHVTPFHNVAPRGLQVGRSSSPGQVRREPITFQCCFSALCKEQSALISIDSRRMLIQCHTDCLHRDRAALACRVTAGCLKEGCVFNIVITLVSTLYNL